MYTTRLAKAFTMARVHHPVIEKFRYGVFDENNYDSITSEGEYATQEEAEKAAIVYANERHGNNEETGDIYVIKYRYVASIENTTAFKAVVYTRN